MFRMFGTWDGPFWKDKALGNIFSHGLKMRDLDSQREGGRPCGRNGMNRLRGRNQQVTEDKKGP